MTERETMPAIVRDYNHVDTNVDVISEPYNSVTHRRGFGDSGYKVQTVEHDCPDCSFDRMVRRIDISPEFRDEVRYWCLNPNCQYYLRELLSHAMAGSYPDRIPDEPAVMEVKE